VFHCVLATGINFEISVVWLASQCWSAEHTAAIFRPDVACVLQKRLCLYARLHEGCNALDNSIQHLVVHWNGSFGLANAFDVGDDDNNDGDLLCGNICVSCTTMTSLGAVRRSLWMTFISALHFLLV
jgi:hypothetical protein